MVVEAVLALGPSLDISMVGIKKQAGGSYLDSRVVRGVVFKKTFSYAGFEQQPKKIVKPKILLLNLELELKAEKENAEIRIDNPDVRQKLSLLLFLSVSFLLSPLMSLLYVLSAARPVCLLPAILSWVSSVSVFRDESFVCLLGYVEMSLSVPISPCLFVSLSPWPVSF